MKIPWSWYGVKVCETETYFASLQLQLDSIICLKGTCFKPWQCQDSCANLFCSFRFWMFKVLLGLLRGLPNFSECLLQSLAEARDRWVVVLSLLLPLPHFGFTKNPHKKKLHRDVNCVNCVDVLEEAQQWNLCPGSSLSTKHGFWTKPWWNWNSCAFVHLCRPYLKGLPSFLFAFFGDFRLSSLGCRCHVSMFQCFQHFPSPTSPEGENFDPQGTFGRKLRELLERNQEMIQIMEAEKNRQKKIQSKM